MVKEIQVGAVRRGPSTSLPSKKWHLEHPLPRFPSLNSPYAPIISNLSEIPSLIVCWLRSLEAHLFFSIDGCRRKRENGKGHRR